MSTKEQLLLHLEYKPGEYISGETLAQELGVSRNAIWKAVHTLREGGYTIDAAPNRGYALLFDPDRLSAQGIGKYLRHKDTFDISVRRTVDSTNTWARQHALEGASEGTVCIAEGQTAGRGRRGHTFFSPEGTGLYLSIVLRPAIDPDQAHLLTCSAAVAVARAVERIGGDQAAIKWVNDVYLNNRKVAGILTEGSFNMEEGKFDYALVGIGINVRTPKDGWPEDIAHRAGAVLDENDSAAVRCQLAAAVLDEFWNFYQLLPEDTFAEEYRQRCFLLGHAITASAGKRTLRGKAIDLDSDYRLIVEDVEGFRHALSFGEVSVSW